MALFSIFKTPKHQKFDYKPRYWDPTKEDLNNRIKQAQGNDTEAMKARISRGFRRGSTAGYAEQRAIERRRSNKILLITVIVLVFLCYLFLTVYLPEIVKMVEGNSTGHVVE